LGSKVYKNEMRTQVYSCPIFDIPEIIPFSQAVTTSAEFDSKKNSLKVLPVKGGMFILSSVA
jgi:hypothetical protein